MRGPADIDALAQTVAEPEESPPAASRRPGQRVGRFTLLEKLGQGGMGVVYSAYDPDLDRRVAIKLLRATSREPSSAEQARLMREAQAMARLRHPNVVTVYEVGTSGEQLFLAMEQVEGSSLPAELDRLRSAKAPLPWRQIIELFAAAGRGLAAAHAKGMVHRDFKPDNVLVDRDGRVQVADFGLVATTADITPSPAPEGTAPDSPLGSRITEDGIRVGTPLYMPPEQHDGRPADARSDQFSFCVALYEALHGRLPFAGNTRADYAAQVCAGAVLPAPAGTQVPAWVTRILTRGLSVDPAARFASMDDLLAELDPRGAEQQRVGQRTRLFLSAVFGLTWITMPLVGRSVFATNGYGHDLLIAFAVTMAVFVFAVALWARESLGRTAYNRRLAGIVGSLFVTQVALTIGASMLELPVAAVETLFLLLYFGTGLTLTATTERRMWPLSIGYLVGFLVSCAQPDLRQLALAGGNLITLINALVIWGRLR